MSNFKALYGVEGYLKLSQVLELFSISRSTWYAGIQKGRYPKQTKIGVRCARWKVSEIRACMHALDNRKEADK